MKNGTCQPGPRLNFYHEYTNRIMHWFPQSFSHPRPREGYAFAPIPDSALRSKGQHQKKGSSIDQRNKLGDRLVVSYRSDQSPRELCASRTSLGPDLANVAHGTFCRMSDKTLWLVCNEIITSNCFDISSSSLLVDGKVEKASPYKDIMHWRETLET